MGQRLGRTFKVALLECLFTGVWGLVEPRFIADNALWFASFGALGLTLAWFYENMREFIDWKRGALARPPAGYELTDAKLESLARIMGASSPADSPIRDRVGVIDAAAYMVFQEWGRSFEDLDAVEQISAIPRNLKQLVQDAIDGALVIWVKKQRHGGNHINPGPQYWEDHHLDWASAHDETISAKPNGGGKLSQTFDPQVRKSDIERLYGPSHQMIVI